MNPPVHEIVMQTLLNSVANVGCTYNVSVTLIYVKSSPIDPMVSNESVKDKQSLPSEYLPCRFVTLTRGAVAVVLAFSTTLEVENTISTHVIVPMYTLYSSFMRPEVGNTSTGGDLIPSPSDCPCFQQPEVHILDDKTILDDKQSDSRWYFFQTKSESSKISLNLQWATLL